MKVRIFISYIKPRQNVGRATSLRCKEQIELDLSSQYQEVRGVTAEESGVILVRLSKDWQLTVDDELVIEKSYDPSSKSNDLVRVELLRCGSSLFSSKLSSKEYTGVLAQVAKDSSYLDLSTIAKTAELREFKLKVIADHLVCVKESRLAQELPDALMHLVQKLFVHCITGVFYLPKGLKKQTTEPSLDIFCEWLGGKCLGEQPRLHAKDPKPAREAVERRAALVEWFHQVFIAPLSNAAALLRQPQDQEVLAAQLQVLGGLRKTIADRKSSKIDAKFLADYFGTVRQFSEGVMRLGKLLNSAPVHKALLLANGKWVAEFTSKHFLDKDVVRAKGLFWKARHSLKVGLGKAFVQHLSSKSSERFAVFRDHRLLKSLPTPDLQEGCILAYKNFIVHFHPYDFGLPQQRTVLKFFDSGKAACLKEETVAGCVFRTSLGIVGDRATFVASIWTQNPAERQPGFAPRVEIGSQVYSLNFRGLKVEPLHQIDHGHIKEVHCIYSLRSGYCSNSQFEVVFITHYYGHFIENDFAMKPPSVFQLLVRAKKGSAPFVNVDPGASFLDHQIEGFKLILRCHLHKNILMILICNYSWEKELDPVTMSVGQYRIEKDCSLTRLATVNLDCAHLPTIRRPHISSGECYIVLARRQVSVISPDRPNPKVLALSAASLPNQQAGPRPLGAYIERSRLCVLSALENNNKLNPVYNLTKYSFSK